MLFNSIAFLIFLPLVTLGYFALTRRSRRVFLLAASYYFYGVFSVPLTLLLVWSTVLDYTCARIIEASSSRRVRKAALLASVIGNLGTLCTFKYLDFFGESLAALLGFHVWPALNLILPMGISFYTFQTMSYTIDVYRGHARACRSVLDLALYVSFFPQLVAGPIMRGNSLLPQFQEDHQPNAERMLSGALLCVWGLGKKVLIADPVGRIADQVFGTDTQPAMIGAYSGPALILAAYAFALQIYCDFSAYTDIAIGAARILGFRLTKNFDAPYLAVTIRDFWRRWHISLSTWLRDYLYIPLGGSRGTTPRTLLNLMITMLLGGLWHGANWTFVIWGGLHGVYLAVERLLGVDRLRSGDLPLIERIARGALTFHLVCLAWVFFRARTAGEAVECLQRVFTWADGRDLTLAPLGLLGLMLLGQLVKRRVTLEPWWLRRPMLARWICYAGLSVVLVAIAGSRSPEFIYFQF